MERMWIMPSLREPEDTFATLPDPGLADSLDGLVERLRLLKVWAGDPSYESIKDRINAVWTAAGRPASELTRKTTVVDCFRPGRRRLNADLVVGVVQALHPDPGYVTQWQQALRVINGEIEAASQVRVQDVLPRELAEFTGRDAELDQLRHVLRHGQRAGAVVISAIEGMAGVGKTQLAIHAGHLLNQQRPFDRVLFVNLRGFHSDPSQPPADPAAVLEGFLRLLGVPGQKIPHDLDARIASYRRALSGTHSLVVLDNAADADQVRPLLPETPNCLTLVTSRRSMTGLHPATHLTVDVFTPDEALRFLARIAPQMPASNDPDAAARIARCCGHLPLALGLIAGHMRAKAGWTLADHADWLEERHRDRRVDTGIELALDLSYRHLPIDRQRLLRLLALHPGHDLDVHAAAALTDTDVETAQTHLDHLCGDHLLQQGTPGRYTFHDLIRAYATTRAHNEERPRDRRLALTRLFDHYLATAAGAMDILHPAEEHDRPQIPPLNSSTPPLNDRSTALGWLDTERSTLVAVAAHTATHGWPTHATSFSRLLYRYLAGGYHTDAVTVHGHGLQAAHRSGDQIGQAHALTNLGTAWRALGQYGPAAKHLQEALDLFRRMGDRPGQARTLINLGGVDHLLGHYRTATDHYAEALDLCRATGDLTGEIRALNNLALVKTLLRRHDQAADHYAQALTLCQKTGYQIGEAYTLTNLGDVEMRSGHHVAANEHLTQALTLHRQLGNRTGEASTLDSLGTLYSRQGQPDEAIDHLTQALAIARETGDRYSEAWAHNGLGEATSEADRLTESLTHHTDAYEIATNLGDREQQARAHTGLGRVHHCLNDPVQSRHHYEQALVLYTALKMPEAEEIRTHLKGCS